MAMPTSDSLLVGWGDNFDTKVTASPVTYALTATQATAFHTAYAAYTAAYSTLVSDRAGGTQSRTLTAQKNAAKAALLAVGRELYGIVQDSRSVSVADKLDVGVNPRDAVPTPVPVPATAPGIELLGVVGTTVKLRLFDTAVSGRRGKPPGVIGASVFSFIGTAPPADLAGWKFEGNTGRTKINILFPADTAPGTKVWLTASWFNSRKQAGANTDPVAANLPGGSVSALAA